jgi:hypothetical protein
MVDQIISIYFYEIISVSEYLLTTKYWKSMELIENFLYVHKYF